MPVKRNYPTYQPPNYRGMPGTTPPFVPEPIPQNGQVQPPSPDPALPPYMQQPGQVSQPQDQRTILQKLRDPRFAGMLLSMGAALGQPKQFGQTGWGQAAQAMAQGYNFLGMSQAAQEAAKRQHWEDQIRMQELAMKQQSHGVDLEDKKAGIENKKNADIFKRQENVREDRKAETNQTKVEADIRNQEGTLAETAQYHKNQIEQAQMNFAKAMATEERLARENATREERLAAQAKSDAEFKKLTAAQTAARDAARASYQKGMLGVAQQNAGTNATRADTAAAKGTGRNNPNWAKYTEQYQKTMGAIEDSSPEAAAKYADAMVAKEEEYLQKSKPAGPKLQVNGKQVTVDGKTYDFPSTEAAMKYVELKSKERK